MIRSLSTKPVQERDQWHIWTSFSITSLLTIAGQKRWPTLKVFRWCFSRQSVSCDDAELLPSIFFGSRATTFFYFHNSYHCQLPWILKTWTKAALILSYITMAVICVYCSAIMLSHISSLLTVTDTTRVPTQACLEKHTLTELNETCPFSGWQENCLLAAQAWMIK